MRLASYRIGADSSLEHTNWRGTGFVLGVQWHPEFHAPLDASLLPREPLIEAVLKAAAMRVAET